MSAIQVGDVVRLKSGGPAMTVSALVRAGEAKCLWFAADELKEGTFGMEALEAVEVE